MREKRKILVGRVVSDKMDKTVVVKIDTRKPHRLYHRIVRSTKRFKAHDEGNVCHIGDLVRLIESKPISREKRWAVIEIVERGDVADIQPAEVTS
ncbi:MAG: 30S ribosomal protein S17 [Dehalococcoidia bacterium]|nr:30S ribosomal protein S17 [Dehalococcoidia bacterium]